MFLASVSPHPEERPEGSRLDEVTWFETPAFARLRRAPHHEGQGAPRVRSRAIQGRRSVGFWPQECVAGVWWTENANRRSCGAAIPSAT